MGGALVANFSEGNFRTFQGLVGVLGGEFFGGNFGGISGASGGSWWRIFRREFLGSIQRLVWEALVASFSGGILGSFQRLVGGGLVANFSGGIVRKYSGASVGPWWRTFRHEFWEVSRG